MIAVVPAVRCSGTDRTVEQHGSRGPNEDDLFEDGGEAARHESAEESVVVVPELSAGDDAGCDRAGERDSDRNVARLVGTGEEVGQKHRERRYRYDPDGQNRHPVGVCKGYGHGGAILCAVTALWCVRSGAG